MNLGDTYCSVGAKRFGGIKNYDLSVIGESLLDNQGRGRITTLQMSNWLQPKQLLLIPSRVAIALQDAGWILRNDFVWFKPNHMPSSVTDRLANSWEHVFHFVKSRKYFYDLDAIRKPHSNATKVRANYASQKNEMYGVNTDQKREQNGWSPQNLQERFGRKTIQQCLDLSKGKNPGDVFRTKHDEAVGRVGNFSYDDPLHTKAYNPNGKCPDDFWRVTTQSFRGAHFATFPEALVAPIVKSSCPVGGVVLDPFCGSGTSLVVAHKLGRRWLGIDLNGEYRDIALKRLASVGAFSSKLFVFVD